MSYTKTYYILTLTCLLIIGCKNGAEKSTSQIEMEAKQIIEDKIKESGDSVLITKFNLGRVTEYKFEGTMRLDNEQDYDVAAYYDPSDKDGNLLVRWAERNAFSNSLRQ